MSRRSVLARLKVVALFLFVGYLTSEFTLAQVIVNEVVASNSNGILDEDGDHPDWIEFYNASASPVNLSGYGISDNQEELFKFLLPDIEILPNDYYLVFASDKNRGSSSENSNLKYWETVVREGDGAKYIVPTSAVSSSWIQKDFDDSSWLDGTYGFGYGDEDDATIVPNGTGSVFTRSTFTIDDLSVINDLLLHIDFDDGYVAYINGIEISRFNLEGDTPISFDTYTTNFVDDPTLVKGLELPAIPIQGFMDLLVEGENVLAIQVHNANAGSSDMSLIPFLSIARSEKPAVSRGIADKITIEGIGEVGAFYPHLNFKLSSSGETVWLTNQDSVVIDEFTYPELKSDESFGRAVDDENTFYIFQTPTPLSENSTEGFTERSSNPKLIQKGGVYQGSTNLQLEESSLGNAVYFTTDGSEPTLSSQVFGTNSRTVSSTTTYKFKTIEQGKLPSNTITYTYLIGISHDLPVVSISTEPDNLWSDESGIYVRGTNGIDGNGSNGPANWNQDWEIPLFIEYYEVDNTLGFSSGAGGKIYGAWSRLNAQKSLAVYFRGEYDNSELDYKLFKSKEIDQFQAFILRNSGNDFNNTHFRDALMTTLVEESEVDLQAYNPTVVYLNGEYWGIHNMREKINEHYIESNHPGVSSDNIDLLDNNSNVIHGSLDNYSDLLSQLGSANMSDPDEYLLIEELIDIDNYIDYMASQIYYGNTDWPGNNIKYWRDRSPDGKWRWILYDTDFGLGLSGHNYGENTLEFALEPNGPGWPNPSWSTYIFRRMVESDIFVNKFVNRMADLMNTSFEKEHINSVIDSLVQRIETEMPAHKNRWGGSMDSWYNQIDVMRNFGDNRRTFMESHLRNQFGILSNRNIQVSTSDVTKGVVQVNRIIPTFFPWVGRYFSGIPIDLTAIPKRGYKFSEWSGGSTSTEAIIQGVVGSSYTANFVKSEVQISDIVINEIMYNASEEQSTSDWIELYNATNSEIDISGWFVKDEDDTHEFTFPDNTKITGNSYLVIASDIADFNAEYSNISNLFGDLGYSLAGGGDQVRLYDNTGLLVDSLSYTDELPWDIEADGTGKTLELLSSEMDNSFPESWKASNTMGGTPGAANSVLIVSNEREESLPSEISLAQNYPNPFNPSTNISFKLPKQAKIKLSIFDMLGRKVSILADEFRSAGVHTLSWDASQQSSGIYFYRLEVGKEVFTNKMLLIK
tara:strand:- start:6503 stop:10099 length:3597 start_codon:yes stop_codon:yes gene_type:complete